MKKGDGNNDSFSNEPYETNLDKILKDMSLDRPVKDLAKENIELK